MPKNLACPPSATSSCELPNGDRTTHRSTNHFFRATRPAEVLPRVFDGDRQVVATTILTGLGTGRALRHVVPANLSNFAHMVQYSKLVTGCLNDRSRLVCRGAFPIKLRWHGFDRKRPSADQSAP